MKNDRVKNRAENPDRNFENVLEKVYIINKRR